MSEKTKPWWEGLDIAQGVLWRNSIDSIAKATFLSQAVKESKILYEHADDGNLINKKADVFKGIEALGGRCVSQNISSENIHLTDYTAGIDLDIKKSDDSFEGAFVWDDAIVTVAIDEEWIRITATTTDFEMAKKFSKFTSEQISHKEKGRAYVFVTTESGPELRQLQGKSGIQLERNNYPEDVVKAFDHVIEDLKSRKPCGRLVIIDGVPGTGKTYFVRGISNEIEDATFILVPPSMISQMMGPDFIPVLMDYHEDNKPIVFVLEDADECLVERQSDNMTSISSLLNLGDGIFGSLFDIRIIATTNAKKMDMDPAIMRKRRLCRHIEIGELEMTQANRAYQKLIGDTTKELPEKKKGYTLAEVYSAATEAGWDGGEAESGKSKGTIGFFGDK